MKGESLLRWAALAIARRHSPGRPGAALERAGWEAVAAGQADVAAGVFSRAITADPGNARLQLGAATAAFMQRRDEDAKRALDRALTLDPSLAGAELLMGQVLRRMGDLPGAIRVYEKLANDSTAKATLERWRRELELQQKMQQTVGDHFAVSFEGPPDDPLAARVMQSLDRAYWRIGTVLNTLPNVTVPVVLYTTQQFSDLTRSPAWAAGAYDGTIRVPMRERRRMTPRWIACSRTSSRMPRPHAVSDGHPHMAERRTRDGARIRRPRMGGADRRQVRGRAA